MSSTGKVKNKPDQNQTSKMDRYEEDSMYMIASSPIGGCWLEKSSRAQMRLYLCVER
ncbi:hypothetical protein CC1G_04989 [Coprinopsis cinerea okayama7|uniref:Uncharacterized protein n=1 Tax=Coprinopsis cinerea (strain Okayama-7 / 130 / ATCC MYA-4618 / FGSC 9003) TaxID=240176 RepID=A8NSE9_COPC7|nr:hypothetical protein CC1G_04989 [Coprinopsis cinerea okayama7\|eukprot:XP_001835996.2 hypothetical protein CC1G_04989 [Coprinopsis cinerea okayama7\